MIEFTRVRVDSEGMEAMLLWILLVGVYLTALFLLGLNTLRKGHTALFWFGIILPFLWIVGALMAPTAEAEARAGLQ